MYLLGYDLGSSSIKAALVEVRSRKMVALESYPETEMEIRSKEIGWAEQEPSVWWKNVQKATKKVPEDKRDILGEEIARVLNDEPRFCEPFGNAENFQDDVGVDDEFSFKPLISAKNYRFLKKKLESWTTTVSYSE